MISTPSPLTLTLTKTERRIVHIVSGIQFVNILDFMMVMPLGPDFARALEIPTDLIGYIGGAYTAAAFLSGFAGSLYLDRLDRRKALAFAMIGLVLSTAIGGLAIGFKTLMMARFLAGAFGGPAASLALAIVADGVAPQRRGRAMGMVAGGYSAASVLGLPIGLQLAQWGGWRLPFFCVSALGLLVVFAAIKIMAPQAGHLAGQGTFDIRERLKAMTEIALRPITMIGFMATIMGLFGNFLLIPTMSTYFQFNLGFPRSGLALLYACGGSVSFFGMRYVGRLVDRAGAARVGVIVSLFQVAVYYALFVHYDPAIPILFLFTLFMAVNSARFVIINTTTSKIPGAHERAGFMALMTSVQHFSLSAAAFVSSMILVERDGGALDYIPLLGLISGVLALIVPFLIYVLERRLINRDKNNALEQALEVTAFD